MLENRVVCEYIENKNSRVLYMVVEYACVTYISVVI
jgi:hypothetical protein